MLPGKTYAPDDILGILRNRAWFILVPLAVIAAGVAVWARSLPDLYRSQTTILVVPQRISESLVQSTITSSIEGRLPSIRQSILSRARLEALINEFDLYPVERQTMVMEDIIDRMRNEDIQTDIIRGDAFGVSYIGKDPAKVLRVAERLGSMFISQSLSYRHDLAQDTDEFLDSQLAETRRQLEENQERLADYKRTYAGQLPSQVDSNLQQVTSANQQVLAAQDAIGRSMERRSVLEARIAQLETPGAAPVASDVLTDRPVTAGGMPQQLADAQQAMAGLEVRGLKPGHPDLEAARRQVRDLEQKLAGEAKNATPPGARPVTAADASRLARLAQDRAELVELDRQIAANREDERQARAAAQAAQVRLEALPIRESEMVALTRDYEILEQSYRELLAKRAASRISTNLELRQVGEQFNVVEPARMPERPFSPDRQRFNIVGIVIGLVFGLVLVGVMEFRDRTFKAERDLALILDLPVLAVVPLMQSPQERRRAKWRRVATLSGCVGIVATSLAVFLYAAVLG
jgi:polysaccharide chain length determinant protein (PEP-CTERM system associated)